MGQRVVFEPGPRSSDRRRLAVVLAVIGCTLAIGACGSGTAKPTASSDPAFEFARCMRAHSVPNFPDPTKGSGGEGFSIVQTLGSSAVSVNGIAFDGPAFQSAAKACDRLDGVFSAPAAVSESQKVGMTANAHCIRRHGIPNFPDPTFGRGIGVNLGPGENTHSPAIERAARACARVGVPIPGVGVG